MDLSIDGLVAFAQGFLERLRGRLGCFSCCFVGGFVSGFAFHELVDGSCGEAFVAVGGDDRVKGCIRSTTVKGPSTIGPQNRLRQLLSGNQTPQQEIYHLSRRAINAKVKDSHPRIALLS